MPLLDHVRAKVLWRAASELIIALSNLFMWGSIDHKKASSTSQKSECYKMKVDEDREL